MKKSVKISPEVRARMLFEHRNDHPSQWATVESISANVVAPRRLCGAGCEVPDNCIGLAEAETNYYRHLSNQAAIAV